MYRSSTKSIGFLLLLWIGIFLPVTEYQVSHAGGLSDFLGISLNAEPQPDASDLAKGSKTERYKASVSLDLSDFTLVVGPQQIALKSEPLHETAIDQGFASRALPPQERPPNATLA